MTDWEKIYKETFSSGESPFYTDFLHTVQEKYPGAGLDKANWGTEATHPYLYSHKGEIIEHFNLRYYFREIGAETEERWQYLINRVFDNIKRKYDYYFMLYENNEL